MRRHPTRESARAGVSVIEIVVVMTIMAVSVSIFSGMIVTTARQRAINRENAQAAEGARRAIEMMRNVAFEDIYASFNADPADDPDGPGTAPGHRFDIPELEALESSPDGLVAEITMPDLLVTPPPSGVPGEKPPPPFYKLVEKSPSEELGMPRDLNGDSVIDDLNHAQDYLLLPVKVRAEWTGVVGPRDFELYVILTDFQMAE